MFFERIGNMRMDHDKTQKDIAELLNCNRQVYARYERGIREIPVSILIVLAEYYNTSADYLLGRTDNPNPYERKHTK